MAARWCAVCDEKFLRGEPRGMSSGELIHRSCDMSSAGVCENRRCEFWRLEHAGLCIV